MTNKLIKVWNRFEVKVGDATVSMKIKRLRYGEAGPVLMTILRALVAREDMKDDAPNADRLVATEVFLAALDVATVRDAFEKYVKDVEGLETEEGPVTTGIGLYEVADVARLLEVLGELRRLSNLTAAEADFFDSPSTSSSTPAPSSTSSDAGSIGSVDGPESTPSTATAIPGEPTSSIEAES